MGWGSGATIGEEFWSLVKDLLPKKEKKEVARGIIFILEDGDCDTIQEMGDLYDVAGGDRWYFKHCGWSDEEIEADQKEKAE